MDSRAGARARAPGSCATRAAQRLLDHELIEKIEREFLHP
jgi:hypothetical protein